MQTVALARNAMATRFEIVLHGANENSLRAAGEEALEEVLRIENQLSLYRPGSEIAQVNARAAREAVLVSPEVFALLQHAQRLSEETDGAFDITIAPLVRCWGFMGGQGKMPTEDEVAAAREKVGFDKFKLDEAGRTVRFTREGVGLDLGAIGKGYAIERAGRILREVGVKSALIHGGTSSACAIGHPPDSETWKIAVDFDEELERQFSGLSVSKLQSRRPESESAAAIAISLRDESLSVSAASGRQFEFDGKLFGHVIDPRTGHPAKNALLSIVALPSATETDALSTALLTLGLDGFEKIASLRPGMRAMTFVRVADEVRTESRGFAVASTNRMRVHSREQIPI
jgi:FAD:protein FMN transferase